MGPIHKAILVELFPLKGLVLQREIVDFLLCIERVVRHASPIVVEVGTYQGKTTRMIAKWLDRRRLPGFVVSIDARSTIDPSVAVDSVVRRRVVFLTEDSTTAAKKLKIAAGLVFVDGCHCRSCVAADAKVWAKKIVVGGVLAFHDASKDGSELPASDQSPEHGRRCMGVSAGIADAAKALAAFRELRPWGGGHTRVFERSA